MRTDWLWSKANTADCDNQRDNKIGAQSSWGLGLGSKRLFGTKLRSTGWGKVVGRKGLSAGNSWRLLAIREEKRRKTLGGKL